MMRISCAVPKKAKAAVQIDSGSVALSTNQVQSIVHLVASSVKDLAPDGVTVCDEVERTSADDAAWIARFLLARSDATWDGACPARLARATGLSEAGYSGEPSSVAGVCDPGGDALARATARPAAACTARRSLPSTSSPASP